MLCLKLELQSLTLWFTVPGYSFSRCQSIFIEQKLILSSQPRMSNTIKLSINISNF